MALFDSTHTLDAVDAADQNAVFEALATKAVELGVAADASAIVSDLHEREAEASTGFGNGVAVPHTKSANVSTPAILFARLTAPVEWHALPSTRSSTFLSPRVAATPICSCSPNWRVASCTRISSTISRATPSKTCAPSSGASSDSR